MKWNAAGIVAAPLLAVSGAHAQPIGQPTKVALVKTTDRVRGVEVAADLLSFNDMNGAQVLIKPNFNTADAPPGSTHNDTLAKVIDEMRSRGGENITIGESSGPPQTSDVLRQKGIVDLAESMEVGIVNYDELAEDDWAHFNPDGIHWSEGFSVPRMVSDAERFVSVCCLKTHGFGGVFTMSLKLAVGLIPKPIRREMHGNSTHMRHMIAEINLGYQPDLIIMDGIETFTDGGPMSGTMKPGNVVIAGTDRVAVDAVGLAVLKDLGSNDTIMGRGIFEQEQIARAAELGLGVSEPGLIELVTPDQPSRDYAARLTEILSFG